MARRRRQTLVLFFLCITVVAPLAVYTDRLATTPTFVAIDHLDDEIPFQESLGAVKEPAWPIFPKKLSDSNQIHAHSGNDAPVSGAREIYLSNAGDRPNRVLSEDIKGTRSEAESRIKQVTNEEGKHAGLQEGETKGEEMPTKFHKTISKTLSVNQDLHNPEMSSKVDSSGLSLAKVQQFKDQLIRAKVYLSLSPSRTYPEFIRELRARVREVEHTLGDATNDTELPKGAHEKLKMMEQTLAKGRQIHNDCSSVIKKLRAFYQSAEDQLRAQKKQELFLTQVAAKTLPRGLHCLPLHLTTAYHSLDSNKQQFPHQEKLEDPKLFHYALFSDNVLATAAVVNSTILNAKYPENHVFHIVTDRLNYAAMKMWFLANPPGKAAIQVQNVDEFTWLNSSYSPVLKQLGSQSMIDYYFKSHLAKSDGNLKFRNPKYLSILNHLRFYLPEIFPKLSKVVFLDDDVIVQKDLSSLWAIDLKEKVNGAAETCGENFHRFDRYLNFSNPLIAKNFDPRACGWAYGMNVFDLIEWRKQNITEIYHHWQKLNEDRLLWKLGTLPPGLITFWKRTYPLDRSWHVLGLGYSLNVSQKDIAGAAVIHYNGNMKPWLEIGIGKYRNYWSKYVNYDQVYLRDCNINP
ncbi:probable galacturonosyltransferase 4 [Zingiber officinale]|uniref:Hexosyltransferase n=1 Tax=Zingiber officinale TaxID=94328 RepID=A0A8J5GNL5_ZINOF|nr:probable galacturonosyltransferase 4 [Zingiber officinale]KAG6504478.1 hypothetical protein ZIOFF_036811 [Zingiber officinale]